MKLLTRTVRNYLIYSTLLILLCTPLFYVAIHSLFVRDMDKVLASHKKEFNQSLTYLRSKEDLAFFHLVNKEFIVRPVNELPAGDSLFTETIYDAGEGDEVPHRVLQTGFVLNGQAYQLRIQESMVSNTGLIAAITAIEMLVLLLLLAGLVLINRRLARKIWEPFYVILDRLKKYQIDRDHTLELPDSSTAEFRELARGIGLLIHKSHEAYLSQKEFTENAAHELQTPLAICRTKLELLAQTSELTREQAELVGSLLDATDRIRWLNKSLLLLSRIENRQFADVENMKLEAVAAKSLDAYREQAEEKHLDVQPRLGSHCPLKGNPVLAEILVSNLVSNAVRHSPDNGTVIIETGKNYVRVSNSGTALENPGKIFSRFYRESRTNQGSGLGLSIVKKICDLEGYHVSYNYDASMHHFKISFDGASDIY